MCINIKWMYFKCINILTYVKKIFINILCGISITVINFQLTYSFNIWLLNVKWVCSSKRNLLTNHKKIVTYRKH